MNFHTCSHSPVSSVFPPKSLLNQFSSAYFYHHCVHVGCPQYSSGILSQTRNPWPPCSHTTTRLFLPAWNLDTGLSKFMFNEALHPWTKPTPLCNLSKACVFSLSASPASSVSQLTKSQRSARAASTGQWLPNIYLDGDLPYEIHLTPQPGTHTLCTNTSEANYGVNVCGSR